MWLGNECYIFARQRKTAAAGHSTFLQRSCAWRASDYLYILANMAEESTKVSSTKIEEMEASSKDSRSFCACSAQKWRYVEISALALVMLVVWVSLALPVIFFYLPVVRYHVRLVLAILCSCIRNNSKSLAFSWLSWRWRKGFGEVGGGGGGRVRNYCANFMPLAE